MGLNISYLVDQVYPYYPRRCSPFSDVYDTSPETILKIATVKELKAGFSVKWNRLVSSISLQISGHGLCDETPVHDNEFCNYLVYIFTEQNLAIRLHLLVSVLQPMHTILLAIYDTEEQEVIGFSNYAELKTQLKLGDHQWERIKEEVCLINTLVKRVIGTNEVQMKDLQNTVPDIELQHKKGVTLLYLIAFSPRTFIYTKEM